MYLKCRDCEDEASIIANKFWIIYRQDKNNTEAHIRDELEFDMDDFNQEDYIAFCQHCFNENNWYNY